MYGRHNVYNALAAAAVAEQCGFPPARTAAGLAGFRGIRRRFERLGKLYGAELIADYAHHPREIAAALETARQAFGGRLFVVFQPHTYSRTRLLFDEFLSVLSGVEDLVIYKTYPAREYFDAAGSALTLAEKLPQRAVRGDAARAVRLPALFAARGGHGVVFGRGGHLLRRQAAAERKTVSRPPAWKGRSLPARAKKRGSRLARAEKHGKFFVRTKKHGKFSASANKKGRRQAPFWHGSGVFR